MSWSIPRRRGATRRVCCAAVILSMLGPAAAWSLAPNLTTDAGKTQVGGNRFAQATDPASPTVTAPPAASPPATIPSLDRAAPAEPISIPEVEEDHTLPRDLSPWGMFMAADRVVKAVMVGLALASVLSWTVWLAKSVELLGARRHARKALHTLSQARTLHEGVERLQRDSGPVARFVRAAESELRLSADALEKDGVKERIASRLERIEAAASRRMNRGTGILATIGSTGPFVGLFGTVWGIMNSFIGISKAQTTNLAVVAPGIAEALLATALGLAAAIPAVVIFNVFARSIAAYRGLLGDGTAETMRLVSRDFDRRDHAVPARNARMSSAAE